MIHRSNINSNIVLTLIACALTGCGDARELDLRDEDGAPPRMIDLELPAPDSALEGAVETDAPGAPLDTLPPSELDGSDDPSSEAAPGEGQAEPPSEAEPPSDLGEGEPGEAEPPAPVPSPFMRTNGKQLLDSCGNVFVTRGVEQIFGEQLPQGNDWAGLVEQIEASGANAIRILPVTDTLSVRDVDRLLEIIGEHHMVGYVTPYGRENIRWLEREDVKAMLAKHERYIIIDAFGEPTFDDRARFIRDSTETIRRVRSLGYRVPLTVTANQYGRDLPSLLELGEQIVAADPLNNTILGWQAYWGSSGFYQQHYGLSLSEAMDAVAKAPFPLQLGLDHVTDYPSSQTADFGFLLSRAEEHGVGWLWWDWYNPYGNENNLTRDGSAERLTSTGEIVLRSHPASVARTAQRACANETESAD